MVNRIWPTAVAGKADSVSAVSASASHIGGPNSVNPGQILLAYGNHIFLFYKISYNGYETNSRKRHHVVKTVVKTQLAKVT